MGRQKATARTGWGAVLVCFSGFAVAEVIDRVAVSAGNRVITEGQLRLDVRVVAFLNNEPVDMSPETLRRAANRLVDQMLVARELELSRFPAPAAADTERELAPLKKARFASETEYRQALARYGIGEDDVRRHLHWQNTFLRFIELRFRPAVQVSDKEVLDYFEKNVRPRKQNGADRRVVDDYREEIEQALTAERVDRQLEEWLKEARRRAEIKFREEVFR